MVVYTFQVTKRTWSFQYICGISPFSIYVVEIGSRFFFKFATNCKTFSLPKIVFVCWSFLFSHPLKSARHKWLLRLCLIILFFFLLRFLLRLFFLLRGCWLEVFHWRNVAFWRVDIILAYSRALCRHILNLVQVMLSVLWHMFIDVDVCCLRSCEVCTGSRRPVFLFRTHNSSSFGLPRVFVHFPWKRPVKWCDSIGIGSRNAFLYS